MESLSDRDIWDADNKSKPGGRQLIEIEDSVFHKWLKIGAEEGLTTDTEIAVFLTEQYICEKSQKKGVQSSSCVKCSTSLLLICPKCQPPSPSQATTATTMQYSPPVSSPKAKKHTKHENLTVVLKQQQGQYSDMLGQVALASTESRKENSTDSLRAESGCAKWNSDKTEGGISLIDDKDDSLPVVFESNSHDGSDSLDEILTETDKKDKNMLYSCAECAAIFKWKQSLREHMQKVHSVTDVFPCKICERRFPSYLDVKRHMQSHEKPKPVKKHCCSECDAAFVKAWDLKLHRRKHTGERPFVCSVCGSGFKTKDKLKIHMRCHTGEKPYICQQCGATFRQSGILQSHMRTHTGEKPYICKECGVAFAQSSALKTHVRIHTGEKSHMCTVCGAAFAASSRLDRHMRVHTGDRPYVCSECGSAFKSSRELACHSRTHTKYKPAVCKVCGSSFSQVGYLKIHMRVHTGEKPYQCGVCSMAFRQPSGLKMHKLKHTDEKPCVCNFCGTAFRRSDTLKNHLQKKHYDKNLTSIL